MIPLVLGNPQIRVSGGQELHFHKQHPLEPRPAAGHSVVEFYKGLGFGVYIRTYIYIHIYIYIWRI